MLHALRHAPDEYGLALDADGWASVKDLVTGLTAKRREWSSLQPSDIERAVSKGALDRIEA